MTDREEECYVCGKPIMSDEEKEDWFAEGSTTPIPMHVKCRKEAEE